MSRPLLPAARTTEAVQAAQARFQADVVAEVQAAVASHDVVVVGMKWNPHVPAARRALDAAGIPHHDLDYGSYLTGWKRRLALKLWTGWPTFPQVFVKGTFVGGSKDLERALADGTVKALLARPAA